jgi:hypothetical protein
LEPVDAENPYGLQLWSVESPTGSIFHLQTEAEAKWYERQKDEYLKHNRFTNVSDMQDLDRLLMLEIMIYRWSTWLTQGFDYLAARVNEKELKDSIKEYSVEIRQLKGSLGIDRVTRERDKGETVGDYIHTLLIRAKEFGVERNTEYEKSVTLIWELINIVQTFDRCDEQERRELKISPEEILQWIRENLITEWDAIMEAFRKNQKMWILDL